jgi:hypothetical protein
MRRDLIKKFDRIEYEIKIKAATYEAYAKTPIPDVLDDEMVKEIYRSRSELLTSLNLLCQTEIDELKREYAALLVLNSSKYSGIEYKINDLHEELNKLLENVPEKKILFFARMDCVHDNLISQYNLRRELFETLVDIVN